MSTPATATRKGKGKQAKSAAAAPRDQRLGLRVPAHLKERIEQAAAYRGMSVSEFLLSTASEEATRTIERHNRFELDAEASRRFVEALSGPGRPRKELVDLFRT